MEDVKNIEEILINDEKEKKKSKKITLTNNSLLINKKNQKGNEGNFFRYSDTHQPSLLTSIDLKPGVNVKEGDGLKQGPLRIEESKHMSRKQFTLHQSMLLDATVNFHHQTLSEKIIPQVSLTHSKIQINSSKQQQVEKVPETNLLSPSFKKKSDSSSLPSSPMNNYNNNQEQHDINLVRKKGNKIKSKN